MFFNDIHKRIRFIFLMVLLIFSIIVIRVFYVEVIMYDKLNINANNLWSRNLPIGADRGNIYDRNGKLLAGNLTTVSLVLIPNQIDDKEKVKECWGDDWDDTPYEHNAGDAYDEYYDYYVDLFFPFNYHILTPADDWHFCGNSPYCKEDFKNRYAPAAIICDDKVADETNDLDISYSKYLGADNDHVLKLFYGDNLFKFMNKIMFFDVVDK